MAKYGSLSNSFAWHRCTIFDSPDADAHFARLLLSLSVAPLQTVGVFGTGKIGQCFIDIMVGFGCKVLCYDVMKAKALEGRKNVTYVSKDEVFQRSDIISLHLPLVKETKHFINKHTLEMMKPHALVINTGRGELVNTSDLLDALRNEKIGGAGLDVSDTRTTQTLTCPLGADCTRLCAKGCVTDVCDRACLLWTRSMKRRAITSIRI